MAYGAITAFIAEGAEGVPEDGVLVTAVFPGECDQADAGGCKGCIVRQRGENAKETYITPEHLTLLLRGFAAAGKLMGAAAVGYEPLLGASRPHGTLNTFRNYLLPFLLTAQELGVRSALVTAGGELEAAVETFSKAIGRPDQMKIVVSIDAGREEHDRLRGVPGLYDKAVAGAKAALAAGIPLAVSTVLHPRMMLKRDAEGEFKEVIDLVASLNTYADQIGKPGVLELGFSPYLISSPGTETRGGVPLTAGPPSLRESMEYLPRLVAYAGQRSVNMTIGDEMQVCEVDGESWIDLLHEKGVSPSILRYPPDVSNIIRVAAHGAVETPGTIAAGIRSGVGVPNELSPEAMEYFARIWHLRIAPVDPGVRNLSREERKMSGAMRLTDALGRRRPAGVVEAPQGKALRL